MCADFPMIPRESALCSSRLYAHVGSKTIDLYALSWGVPRKRAWNLVGTAQRKSQLCYFRHVQQGKLRQRKGHLPMTFDDVLRVLRTSRGQPGSKIPLIRDVLSGQMTRESMSNVWNRTIQQI